MFVDFVKLRNAIARRCFSMRAFLREAHMSSATVKRIREGGKVNTRTVGRLASVLGVDVEDLLLDGN